MYLYSEEQRTFKDRKDAGVQLGQALEKYKDQNVLVIGIPNGGVEVGYFVAKHLNAELSTIVTKKLPYPGQEEITFGVMAEDGSVFISERIKHSISRVEFEKLLNRQKQELERRVKFYRRGKELPDMKGRTIIIVDDGIATGASLVPAMDMCKKRGAAKVIIASPVAAKERPAILQRADDYVILEKLEFFYAVGQVYEEFGNLSDKAVAEILKKAADWKKDESA
ncbi:MAG: phosphoribosyltransferase [Cytophagaceae bacterium]|nr:phosphoribosyltransferase [Cytophagaceae bacterium]